MDYNNAILRGVEYGWSSGTMARAEFFIEVNEKEIVEARYYPEDNDMRNEEAGNVETGDEETGDEETGDEGTGDEETGDEGICKKEHESITVDNWKAVCDAVAILYPVLEEWTLFDGENRLCSAVDGEKKLDGEQILDGGDTFDLAFLWEIDGELVRKTYYHPVYERFCILSTVLTELADPIGRAIPVYTPPILNGVYVVMGKNKGKDRYSFQCTVNQDVPGEYRLFCYYPKNGKEVCFPKKRTDEAAWKIIHDKVNELGLEKQADVDCSKGGSNKGDSKKCDTITLSYSNGRQRKVSLNKENGLVLRNTFLELMGLEPVQEKKTLWGKIFGRIR